MSIIPAVYSPSTRRFLRTEEPISHKMSQVGAYKTGRHTYGLSRPEKRRIIDRNRKRQTQQALQDCPQNVADKREIADSRQRPDNGRMGETAMLEHSGIRSPDHAHNPPALRGITVREIQIGRKQDGPAEEGQTEQEQILEGRVGAEPDNQRIVERNGEIQNEDQDEPGDPPMGKS